MRCSMRIDLYQVEMASHFDLDRPFCCQHLCSHLELIHQSQDGFRFTYTDAKKQQAEVEKNNTLALRLSLALP